MHWNYIAVVADTGIKEGLECTVCKKMETDILYFPANMSGEQMKWIEKIWDCDAFADFAACERCMQGHCGPVPSVNGDNWLEKRIKKYKQKNKPE